MHCDICERSYSSKLPFNCTLCARHDLHQTRIQHARALFEQDVARSQIEHLLNASRNTGLRQSASGDHSPLLTLESYNTRQQALKERTTLFLDHSDHVRADIKKLRAEAASLRSFNLRRRTEIDKARQKLARHTVTDLEQVQKTASHVRQRWDLLHTRTAESRSLLCREAATLYGLQEQPAATTTKKITYTIGGLPIFNLKDLNRANPAEMNAVSGNLAHLVHLISHYLGLRLPAEMVLPHRDCPHPTILPPSQSYAAQQLSFPQIGSAQLSSNSAPASRALLKSQKLRPNLQSLYLTKTLTLLAKDDPRAYAEFLESVTLLAWNIAWLCKSQGIDAEIASWEGVCNIAKNLQHFLATKNVERPLPSAARDSPRRQATYNSDPLLAPADCRDSQQCTTERQRTRLGQLSHDTAHSNLVSAAGSSDMHRWRLQDPSKIVERVKHMLQSDRTGAGWEMLDGKEWEAEPTTAQLTAPPSIVDASPVVVSHRIEADDPLGGPNPKLKTQATADEPEHDKGTSGWTKLKSR